MTRDQLYRCVMCGEVRSGSQTLRDPRQLVDPGQPFTLVRDRYVSRGGEKLHAALTAWGISPAGRTWVDAGASTGGFTDCLLQGGAQLVHAVDVGNNQLDYRLRRDGRVRVRERTNIMDVQELDPLPDAAVCDLSFRSLRGALRHILNLTAQGWGIALLKPQFEAAAEIRRGRRDEVESGGGVVGDDVRDDVVTGVIEDLLRHEGVRVMRQITSPLPGRQGNREELLLVGLVDVLNR
jgi:23S rRNA (cytidine1920-2'-O)/16S rRNA (cytidine1409-2'-O)-methyltransferase